jgi:hypothetical protein
MIRRRTTLEEALSEIDEGTLVNVTAIVVNQEWWQALPRPMQSDYQLRCNKVGVELRADRALSRHFVELASDPREPPLSTESRV